MKGAPLIILRIVAAGHPIGVNEGVIAHVLKSLTLGHAQTRIRAELRCLCDEGAVEIINQGEDGWAAKATPHGMSLVNVMQSKKSAGAA